MQLKVRHLICLVFIATLYSSQAPAVFAQAVDNGIVVGQAKLYDERSLESLLASVKSGLGAGASFVNTAAAAQNGGTLQGGEISTSQESFNLSEVPLLKPPVSPPATTGSATPAATTSAPSAQPLAIRPPSGTPIQSVAPASQTFSAESVGISAPLAISSSDMLQQQVATSFQAINLEMLLEHALSDRLILQNGTAKPRRLAILGFQITVEPRTGDEYSVAQADITVTSPGGLPRPEVALMLPQDKTYNIAKVTNDSKSIGLGAIVQPFLGGLNASSSRSGSFVVYDFDTVALQRPFGGGSASSVTFAWQFRPVLGERSVAPGTRQVYVLLSLPIAGGSDQDYTPTISVKAYWKKYDTKAKTVENDTSGMVSSYDLDPLSICKADDYEDGLAPVVEAIRCHDAGGGNLFVEAIGSNFDHNTDVVLSGRSLAGTQEQGGRLLAFEAPFSSFAYEDPLVLGSYGLPVQMVQSKVLVNGAAIDSSTPGEGLIIRQVQVAALDRENGVVKISLASRHGDVAPILPSNGQLAITIGDEVFGLDDKPVGIGKDPDDPNVVVLIVLPSKKALQAAQKVTVRYLFCGDDYRDDYALPTCAFTADDKISVVSKNKTLVVLAITGSLHQSLQASINGLTFGPAKVVDNSYLTLSEAEESRGPVLPFNKPTPSPEPSYSLALLSIDPRQLEGAEQVVLFQPNSPPQICSLADSLKDIHATAYVANPGGINQPGGVAGQQRSPHDLASASHSVRSKLKP